MASFGNRTTSETVFIRFTINAYICIMQPEEISKYIDQIKKLCIKHSVKSLFAFGSAVSGRLKMDSDIDLIVDIDSTDPYIYADNYFDLKFELESLFHRQVDLLEQKTLKNPYLQKELDRTKVLVYGR